MASEGEHDCCKRMFETCNWNTHLFIFRSLLQTICSCTVLHDNWMLVTSKVSSSKILYFMNLPPVLLLILTFHYHSGLDQFILPPGVIRQKLPCFLARQCFTYSINQWTRSRQARFLNPSSPLLTLSSRTLSLPPSLTVLLWCIIPRPHSLSLA